MSMYEENSGQRASIYVHFGSSGYITANSVTTDYLWPTKILQKMTEQTTTVINRNNTSHSWPRCCPKRGLILPHFHLVSTYRLYDTVSLIQSISILTHTHL